MAKKEYQYLIDAAMQQGWRVQYLSSGHIKLLPPDTTKPAVVMGGSISDRRALQNVRSMLRRSGLVLPENLSGLAAGHWNYHQVPVVVEYTTRKLFSTYGNKRLTNYKYITGPRGPTRPSIDSTPRYIENINGNWYRYEKQLAFYVSIYPEEAVPKRVWHFITAKQLSRGDRQLRWTDAWEKTQLSPFSLTPESIPNVMVGMDLFLQSEPR